MRDRLLDKDQQTHFAKKHYSLGGKAYLTDMDGIQLISYDTENQSYSQYKYFDNTPFLAKFIEVKYTMTNYLKKMLKKQAPPNGQIMVFANTASELNAYREGTNKPKVKFLLVVEKEGDFPYYVFDVNYKEGQINYHYLGQVFNTQEYADIIFI